jgi:hypothetical protein
LAAILNDVCLLELDCPSFGEPLKFEKAFKDAVKSICKLNSATCIMISETQIRDPIYYDFIFTFLKALVRTDYCVVFDSAFKAEIIEVEIQHIRKIRKTVIPPDETCFKQGLEKIKKNMHIVFLFSDLMSYKELFQMIPQLEYMCDIMFLDDLNNAGYQAMTDSFLQRSNIIDDLQQDDNNSLNKALNEVRNFIDIQWRKAFYSTKMLQFTSHEETPGVCAQKFVFPDGGQLNGNVFASQAGFDHMDNNLRQTGFSMPMDMSFLGKHRYGMFLEVFRFLYDLLGMHMSIRKHYYETFLNKQSHLLDFMASLKKNKHSLQDQQENHKFKISKCREKIKQNQKQLEEKKIQIE